MVCVFLLLHIYDHRQNNYHLNYQQYLDMNSNLNNMRMYGNNNEDPKLEKGYNKTNHKEEKPTVAGVQDTRNFHHNDKNWQKPNLLHKPDHTKEKQQNKAANLDSGKNRIHIKETSMELVSDKKEYQTNTANLGINATHINGILMEPVNAKYIRNVFFTIKTTHKYYTDRLFPLMLTWLQAVDKNKVRY